MVDFFAERAWLFNTILVVLIFVPYFLLQSGENRTNEYYMNMNISSPNNPMDGDYFVNSSNDISKHTPPEVPNKNILIGKTRPSTNKNLVSIDPMLASRAGMYMHRCAYEAFKKMHSAAASEGVHLFIVSAFRSFGHQRRIWENKWNGKQILDGNILAPQISNPVERAREILKYSAMPGTSRHHWGTDIDLNSVEGLYFEKGTGRAVYDWLVRNAPSFGFCQPYTAIGDGRAGGYEEEKWHWSYMPVANLYLNTYRDSVSYESLIGFDGWETAVKIEVIKNYVLQINDACNQIEY